MGGNALTCTSVRLTKSNYERMAADCVAKLRERYPGKRVEALGSYREKADFGDCDILIQGGDHYDPLQAAAALDAVEVVRNGPVTSVGVIVRPEVPFRDGNVFQVDLIKMEPEAFDFAVGYFGRGDAGNLLGRLFHACGLALRHDGLVYYFRDEANADYKFREIILTRNFKDALTFLEYDPVAYERGFDTPEDIYRYVASSPFFNPDIFLLENRNAKSRVRDKKRAMYMQFLKFCAEHPELTAFKYPDDKSVWLPRIAEYFPGFQADYEQAQTDLAQLRSVKAKFNGEWVSRLTGLQGKELGAVMQRFKESFPSPEEMRDYILSRPSEAIELRVRRVLSSLKEDGLFPMWELLEAGFPAMHVRAQVARHLNGLKELPEGTNGKEAAVAASIAMLELLPLNSES